MKRFKTILFYSICSFLVLFGFGVNGQGLDIGVGIGGANYDGDLTAKSRWKMIEQTRFAISGFARFELNPWLAGTTSILLTQLTGDDAESDVDWMIERNLSFKTSIIEFSAVVEYHPLGTSKLSPFLAGGFSVFNYHPKAYYNGAWIALRPLGTEGQGLPSYPDRKEYSSFAAAMVLGGGIRYKVNEQISISADLLGRITSTDYIDDVSTSYVDYYELLDAKGLLAASLANRINEGLGVSEPDNSVAGTPRGSEGSKDFYFIGQFKFQYRLFSFEPGGRKVKGGKRDHWNNCPKF